MLAATPTKERLVAHAFFWILKHREFPYHTYPPTYAKMTQTKKGRLKEKEANVGYAFFRVTER